MTSRSGTGSIIAAWTPLVYIIGNNTPQAYPALRRRDAQTGGLLFPGCVMLYDKPPLTIAAQCALLRERGLGCQDQGRMEHYLRHVGYYRLSAYCLPFEVPDPTGNGARSHRFQAGTTFDDVLALYIFDRKFRLLHMEAFERIEVAFRSQWSNAMALRHGSHPHMNPAHFASPWDHLKGLTKVAGDLQRSSETFVEHYRTRYTEPFLPPIWAIVETLSFGALSQWFKTTTDNGVKADVAKAFGMPTVQILEGVMHALTHVRNVCAHHGRLWNRRFVLQLPKIKRLEGRMMTGDIQGQQQPDRRIYNYLIVMDVLMSSINPRSSWRRRLCDHLHGATAGQRAAMGFPEDWLQRQPWAGVAP